MTITGFIGRLFRYKPSLFIVNGILWCIFHSLPLLIGLGMQWFFDRATAQSTDYLWLAVPLIFIAVVASRGWALSLRPFTLGHLYLSYSGNSANQYAGRHHALARSKSPGVAGRGDEPLPR